jgi:hypothetical protein
MVRSITVENFRERSDAVRVNRSCERLQKSECGRAVLVNPVVRERKWAEQPAPDGSLMVGGITLAQPTGINPV